MQKREPFLRELPIGKEWLELSQRGGMAVLANAECGHITCGDDNLASGCEVAIYVGKRRYSCLKEAVLGMLPGDPNTGLKGYF